MFSYCHEAIEDRPCVGKFSQACSEDTAVAFSSALDLCGEWPDYTGDNAY